MAKAALIFLSQARANRDRAERARRLARGASDETAFDNLNRYADELDRIALDLERRACALAETIARTESLSADIRLLVEETHALLRAMSRNGGDLPEDQSVG